MIGSGGGLDTDKVAWRSVTSLTYVRSLKVNNIKILKECQDG
jgi:hypothetical protein